MLHQRPRRWCRWTTTITMIIRCMKLQPTRLEPLWTMRFITWWRWLWVVEICSIELFLIFTISVPRWMRRNDSFYTMENQQLRWAHLVDARHLRPRYSLWRSQILSRESVLEVLQLTSVPSSVSARKERNTRSGQFPSRSVSFCFKFQLDFSSFLSTFFPSLNFFPFNRSNKISSMVGEVVHRNP